MLVYYTAEVCIYGGNMSMVQVSDQLHNTTTSVIVNVLDDNDNAPVFTQSGYEVNFFQQIIFRWEMKVTH